MKHGLILLNSIVLTLDFIVIEDMKLNVFFFVPAKHYNKVKYIFQLLRYLDLRIFHNITGLEIKEEPGEQNSGEIRPGSGPVAAAVKGAGILGLGYLLGKLSAPTGCRWKVRVDVQSRSGPCDNM